MKNRNVIFVGGIHGVGKTTYCEKLSSDLNLKHYSASDLIKEVKRTNSVHKNVKNIPQNQDILLDAIDKCFYENKWYILDGHFCLLNEQGSISPIPFATFQSIGPR